MQVSAKRGSIAATTNSDCIELVVPVSLAEDARASRRLTPRAYWTFGQWKAASGWLSDAWLGSLRRIGLPARGRELHGTKVQLAVIGDS